MSGGYEYFLEEFNNQPGLIRDKFAQASLVQPKLFKDAGWNITLSDFVKSDSYSDNQEIYNTFNNENFIHCNGVYNDFLFKEKQLKSGVSNENADKVCRKQIVNFSVMQILYAPLRLTFYNNMAKHAGDSSYTDFYNHFSTVYYLPQLFDTSSDSENFIYIENEITHCPISLDQNFELPGNKSDKNSLVYYPEASYEQNHYDVNLCLAKTFVRLLDYLKAEGVYDNTRIIVVSDHGRDLDLPCFTEKSKQKAFHNPLLLFKDFNSNGELKTDLSFMTNADSLFLAKENLNIGSINPYTGKELKQSKQNGVNVYQSYGEEYNGDLMRNKSKFTLLKENAVFNETVAI